MTKLFSRWRLGGWALWSIAALFYAYEFLQRVAPSVLTTQLRIGFSVNEHQLATIGAMYFYAYAAFQLPAGILIDRYGSKRILVIASAILTLGSFLFATTTSSTVAHISRFMIGGGSAFAFVGCLKIGSQWLAMSSFPLVVGLTNLFGTLGALSGGTPLSYMVGIFGWRETMMQVSFAGLLITILLWLFLQDKKPVLENTLDQNIATADQPSLFTGLINVLKSPYSWIVAIYAALLVAPIAALPEMWGVEYLTLRYGISATEAAAITHTIFVGTAVGGPLIGWLTTRHFGYEIQFMRIATLGAFVLLSAFLYYSAIPKTYLIFILFGYGVFTANMLLAFALMTEIQPPWAQGAAIGFTNMVVMAMAGFSQHSIGWVLDHLHSAHTGVFLITDYYIAFSVLPCCLILATVLTFFMKRKHP